MVIYGLVIVATNRLIDVISGEHLEGAAAKKLKDNIIRVGGALDGAVNEYRLILEDEQQDASNALYLSDGE